MVNFFLSPFTTHDKVKVLGKFENAGTNALKSLKLIFAFFKRIFSGVCSIAFPICFTES